MKPTVIGMFTLFITTVLLFSSMTATAYAQGTAFNYQGKFTNNGSPGNGSFEFGFKVFDAMSGGNQVGPDLDAQVVEVSNGLFTAQLDFGPAVFTGAPRLLEIRVRPAGSPDPYTVLTPLFGALPSSPGGLERIS